MAFSVRENPRKALAELFDHIWTTAYIGAVGEDRVSEQDDVLAARLRGGGAARGQRQSAGSNERASHDGAAAGFVVKHG